MIDKDFTVFITGCVLVVSIVSYAIVASVQSNNELRAKALEKGLRGIEVECIVGARQTNQALCAQIKSKE
jgi:hypothetical protein